ncbi:MAG TPA: tyrosine-type recombinase/integrase [Ktedonobacteraceae bacterium]|nr:tyrosine-type recombinase/integrase [Ktedonobacteraceae bacterium]
MDEVVSAFALILPDAEPLSQQSQIVAAEASPWERCMTQFLRQIYDRSQSDKSLRDYRRTLLSFFSSSSGGGPAKHPAEYTHEDIEDFLHRPSTSPRNPGQPPSIATINQRLAILSSFYHFASTFTITGPDGRSQRLLQSPSPTLGLHRKKPDRVYRAFSDEELDRFFEVIPTDTVMGLRDRAIFLLYFWTARRREEIARLRWGDIEQAMIVDEHGRRRQGWRYRFYGKGKSGQQDIAELPIPAKLAIDGYLSAARRLQTMRPDDPLFVALGPSQGGGKPGISLPVDEWQPLTSHAIARALKKYARLAGIEAERLTIHSWRHTAAHQRYQAGEDVRSLQRLLRHSNIATTDIYVRTLLGTADPGASLLEARFAHFSDPTPDA